VRDENGVIVGPVAANKKRKLVQTPRLRQLTSLQALAISFKTAAVEVLFD
jgi:hypothetical protein